MEQQKKAELNNQLSSQSGKWSSLFRGQQVLHVVSPVAAAAVAVGGGGVTPTAPLLSSSQQQSVQSLASIQAEQTKSLDSVAKQPASMSQKIQNSNKIGAVCSLHWNCIF